MTSLDFSLRDYIFFQLTYKPWHWFKTILFNQVDGQTAAIDAILNDYAVLMDTLEEIHLTTRDEYGLKAGCFQRSLEKFNTLFGLRLAHTLLCSRTSVFDAPKEEHRMHCLQLIYQRCTTIDYGRRRSSSASMMQQFKTIGQPELPRYRRRPPRFEDGVEPHEYTSARAYYRHIYFQA